MSVEMVFFQAMALTDGLSCELKKSDHMMTNISWLQFAPQLWQIPQK